MMRRAPYLALACALIGLGVSAAATYVHHRLIFDPTYRSFCDVSSTISCTQVYLSRFGTFRGVPVAIFGVFWFVAATLLSVGGLTARPSVRESVPGYLFVLSTLALAVVLYLAYASIVVLKAYCVLCFVTYAAVIGLFLVTGAATSFPMTTLPRRATRDLRVFIASPLAITVAVLFLAGAATTLAFFPREAAGESPARAAAPPPTAAQTSEFERLMATAPRVPMAIPADGAKVLIVDFSDFQCPYCRQAFYAYKPILQKYEAQQPGAVKFVLKDYPLDSECNVNVAGGGPHPSACEAAVAVRLAQSRNRVEAMEEWLFANQPSLTPPVVRQAARDVGQINDFEAKYAFTLDLVKGDIALGHQLGVRSTPTLFINGVKFEGVLAPQYFDQAIAYELKRAAK
ncbi:MAG TPA: vitamin K epoxide reductase family protein [Vicinamibacterales bacterium]